MIESSWKGTYVIVLVETKTSKVLDPLLCDVDHGVSTPPHVLVIDGFAVALTFVHGLNSALRKHVPELAKEQQYIAIPSDRTITPEQVADFERSRLTPTSPDLNSGMYG